MTLWKTPDVKPDIFRPHRILVIYEAHDEPELMFSAEYAALTADRYVNRWCYWDEFIAAADRAEQLQKAVIWLVGGDTGISSKTMCAALFGLMPKDSDMPHDAGDFGRCLRFIRFMPDGTKDIVFKKLSDKPEWVEIGKRWDELVDLYDQENWTGVGDILRTIRKECRQPRPNEIFIGL